MDVMCVGVSSSILVSSLANGAQILGKLEAGSDLKYGDGDLLRCSLGDFVVDVSDAVGTRQLGPSVMSFLPVIDCQARAYIFCCDPELLGLALCVHNKDPWP